MLRLPQDNQGNLGKNASGGPSISSTARPMRFFQALRVCHGLSRHEFFVKTRAGHRSGNPTDAQPSIFTRLSATAEQSVKLWGVRKIDQGGCGSPYLFSCGGSGGSGGSAKTGVKTGKTCGGNFYRHVAAVASNIMLSACDKYMRLVVSFLSAGRIYWCPGILLVY